MEKIPKSMRLHIGIFGRANVGKSSFLNFLVGQDVAIVSSKRGTTTDTVEKTMELLPIGPVVLIDTAGIDDDTDIGNLRVEKTKKVLDRIDFAFLVVEPNIWTRYENDVLNELNKRKVPFLIILNKSDLGVKEDFRDFLKKKELNFIEVSSISVLNRDNVLDDIKRFISSKKEEENRFIINDLIKSGSYVVLVIPIDKEAPKGRIILPQNQVIRELLDGGNFALCVRDIEYPYIFKFLRPDLVVCDSQVVKKINDLTPADIKLTTFSILFSRFKGDFNLFVEGTYRIKDLKPGDRIAVFEGCSHHPIGDDIARVKIPKWLREFVGGDLVIDYFAGLDFPQDLSIYKLAVHCGGCVLTSKTVLRRQYLLKEHNIPITNYGMLISYVNGCFERVIKPIINP